MNYKLLLPQVVLFTLLISGCMVPFAGTKYQYTYSLVDTNNTIVLDTTGTMHFEDSLIDVVFAIGQKQISFIMKNKSAHTIKLNWDETLFIKFGTPGKVMHSGVKYTERNNSQPMSIIPSGTSHEDIILPTENVYWRDGYYSQYGSSPGGWEERDLFPSNDMNKPEYKELILSNKGIQFRVFMPILVNGIQKEYNFNFKILNVTQIVKPNTY
jgi:hypothetical protein